MTKRQIIILAAVTALGCAVRLCNLGDKSLTADEIFEYRNSSPGTREITRLFYSDVHPLFRIIHHFWIKTGDSEESIRMFSVIAGTMAIPGIYALAMATAGEPAAGLAALFLAVSPIHISISQEARMYALLALATIISMTAFLKITSGGGAGWLALFAATGAAACHIHIYFALLLAAQSAIGMFILKRLGRRRTAFAIALAAAWLPVLVLAHALARHRMAGFGSWIEQYSKSVPQIMAGYFNNLTFGEARYSAGYLREHSFLFVIEVSCYFAVIASLVAACRNALRRDAVPNERILTACTVLTVAGAAAFNLLGKTMVSRYLYYLVPCYLCMIAAAIGGLKSRAARAAMAAVIVAAFSANAVNTIITPKEGWKEAVAAASARMEKGDVFLFYSDYTRQAFEHYMGRAGRGEARMVVLKALASVNDAEQVAEAGRELEGLAGRARIWVIPGGNWETDPRNNYLKAINSDYQGAFSLEKQAPRLYLYARRR